mmetsp:Transcript_49181/g.115632  ORF Transcript_49181/g.115632 Transcript_49181/m.115632 type:complete len:93 (-) Transcript_49181:31-309(-)
MLIITKSNQSMFSRGKASTPRRQERKKAHRLSAEEVQTACLAPPPSAQQCLTLTELSSEAPVAAGSAPKSMHWPKIGWWGFWTHGRLSLAAV